MKKKMKIFFLLKDILIDSDKTVQMIEKTIIT